MYFTDSLQRMMIISFTCVFAHLVGPSLQWSRSAEQSLRNSLASSYMTTVRPEETVNVYLGFQISTVKDVDIKTQTLEISGQWALIWNDTRFTWNETDHDNITCLQFYDDYFWRPAIVVINSNTELAAIDEETVPARALSTGLVVWQPPGVLSLICEMDSTYFPFDEQTCGLMVTTYGFDMSEVNLIPLQTMGTDFYMENGDWTITDRKVERKEFADLSHSYSLVTFSMTMKRQSVHHWISLILPVWVNAVLVVFVFLLPPDSGEKMGYSLTVLLGYVVLLTLLADDIPTSAKNTCLLELYVTINLSLSSLSVFLSQLILHAFFRDAQDYAIDGWILKATRLAMTVTRDPRRNTNKIMPNNSDAGKGTATTMDSFQKGQTKELENRPPSYTSVDNGTERDKILHPSINQLLKWNDQDQPNNEITWKVVANVMDAFCLRLYITLHVLLTITFLLTMTLASS